MDEPRFLADEMLGRLARYLRILGYDTAYVRDLPDGAIAARASAEGRVLLSRDRALCHSVPGSVRLRSEALDDQLLELRRERPELRSSPQFTRCTICNGELDTATGIAPEQLPDYVASRSTQPPRPLYRCSACGQFYWEGTHTESVRGHLRALFAPETG